MPEAVGKTEARIVADLLGSGLGQEDEALQRDLETWERSLEDLQRHKQEMVGQCSGQILTLDNKVHSLRNQVIRIFQL